MSIKDAVKQVQHLASRLARSMSIDDAIEFYETLEDDAQSSHQAMKEERADQD